MLGNARKVAVLGDIRLYECPLSYITAETGEILQVVFLVTETHIPFFPGGWAEQPHWLSEAVALYKKEVLEWTERQRVKSEEGRGKKDNINPKG